MYFCLLLTFAHFRHGILSHCMTTSPLYILSTANGHLNHFQLGAITDNVGMSLQKACLCTHVRAWVSLGYRSGRVTWSLYVPLFSCIKQCQSDFQDVCANFYSPTQCGGSSVSCSTSSQTLGTVIFFEF